jgi:hypothetical protein
VEFIWIFIHTLFNFIDHCYNNIFNSLFEISSTSLSLVFHISYASALEFAPLRPNCWLEVLITSSLSVEIFSAFRQVTCYFSSLN